MHNRTIELILTSWFLIFLKKFKELNPEDIGDIEIKNKI
jgi:hypothetical protein